ncbi:AIPR family protein [Tenacibaculum finnmarkense]|uniref:AIPR family protein n=1 Tax=Tenacibaculum finnmarkense TaxID=2781243 RepID=UPI001EFB6B8C|nr:AIPR family protein [Tenacibaculum finnmarkense]MCG8805266.1 AIPR family protein [Tenacibaculum finnmarkense]MCG8856545.1 AIPR family protein [Tenacibaculum finnmarkense]
MHLILKKNIEELQKEFGYIEDDSKNFEIFCNYCVASKSYLGRFNPINITTDEDDASIDGIVIIIDGELITTKEDAEEIFDTHKTNFEVKLILTQVKSGEKFNKSEIANFNLGIKDFLSLNPQLPNGELNKEAISILNVIYNNLRKVKRKLPEIEIYYCSSGVYKSEREIEASFKIIERDIIGTELFHTVSINPIGRSQLTKIWNSINDTNEVKLKLIEYFGMPPMPNIPQSYVTLVNAKEFVDKVLKDENGIIKNEVFEENIRAFLGDTPVNKKISDTLNSVDKKKIFSVLNNGITIVTPELTLTPNSKEIDLVNYQIINGCQTSNTLFENYSSLDNDINIVVKCIESSNDDNISDIIDATNSQTNIPDEAFYSLKEKTKLVQKYFEIKNSELSREFHLYFERRENEFKNKDFQQARIYDIKLLCRAYNAMFLNQPFNSARYVSQIFKIQKDNLFKESDQESMYYTSALTLYRFNNLVNIKKHNAHKYVLFRWHILEIFKHVIHKKVEDIKPNSNKANKYCEKVIKILNSNNRAYESIFKHCYEIINLLTYPSKDVLKRSKYNQELLEKTKEYVKKL